jgi:hypothetical protein
MHRLLTIMALAATLMVPLAPAADAQQGRKKQTYPSSRDLPPPSYVAPPVAAQVPSGPPWAGPNQCWTDLGYGRWEQC